MKKYRILCLDGGGLRGLITARLLQRLSEESGAPNWLTQTDLFSGTSTGGILALALASGKKPQDICDLYLESGSKIFADSLWDNLKDLGKTVGAGYSNEALRRELNQVFGESTLGKLHKKVAIPAFDLDNDAKDLAERCWKPKIFHNYAGNDSDGARRTADVALYTSSAPTYFPSADGYIDGGVFANNPSIVAIAQAISNHNLKRERTKLENVVLLSVGTGVSLNYIEGQSLDWGYAQWMKPLINLLQDGVAGVADYQASQLLGDRYKRLQVFFAANETISLDDVQKLPRMDEIARAHDLSSVKNWLKTHWL